MRQIYIEVPTTTKEVMMSIPYRKSSIPSISRTVQDSEDDKDWSIQSKQVMSKNMRTVEFEFDFRDDDGIKLHVSTKIMLSYSHRCIMVDW